jgi:uncharacterized membrane protein
VTVTRNLRRRLDYRILRWQARLDAAWADRMIPWLGTIGLFVVLAAMSLARARSLETGNDLATWVQGAWMITTGREPDITVTGQNLFEPQLAVGFWPIAQATRVVATIPYLLLLQSLALSLGLTPVWRLCRRVCNLRVGAAAAAVVAYAAFPALHELNLSDFHPEALALPALLWAGYQAERGRWRWAVPLVVVALSLRSDLGLTVAAMGVAIWWGGRGRGGRRLAVLGIAWTLLAQLVIQPWIGDGTFVHAGAFTPYGDTARGVIWGMVTHPWDVVVDLTARENFVVLIALLAPVAFVPLLAVRRILPFAPIICLYFVADVPIDGGAGVQLLVPAAVGIFLALPFGLERLGRRNIERVTVDSRLLTGLVLASLSFFVLLSPASPYESPWEWGGRDRSDSARLDAIDEIAADERVRASSTMIAELASRPVILTVDTAGLLSGVVLAEDIDVVVVGPEVLLTDVRDGLDFEVDEPIDGDVVSGWRDEIEDEGFELVSDDEGVLVYRRER